MAPPRARAGVLGTAAIAVLCTVLGACGGGGGIVSPSVGGNGNGTGSGSATGGAISLSASATTVSVLQGQAGTVTLTVGRSGGFAGAVSLAVTGVPNGVTSAFTSASLSGTETSSALTLTASPQMGAGSYGVTVHATGSGVTEQTVGITLTVAPAPQPAITLAVSPPSLAIAQGQSGTVTVTLTRANYPSDVALAVTGAPSGVTISPTPATLTGSTLTSTLNVASASSATPGTYTVTVTGTGTGVAPQTATFALQVIQQPTGGGNVTFTFANCAIRPLWFAVQNGGGAWTRVQPGANNAFSFTIGANGGVAYVQQFGVTSYETTVLYGSANELAVTSALADCTVPAPGAILTRLGTVGTKQLSGSIAGLSPSDQARVSIGGFEFGTSTNGALALGALGALDGPRDVIATRFRQANPVTTVSKIILRRDTNYPDRSAVPLLDFGSTEAFDAAQATVTVNNLGTDVASPNVRFFTANSGWSNLYLGSGSIFAGNTLPFFAVPASQLRPSDLQQLVVAAGAFGSQSLREVYTHLRTATDQTVTLGPTISPVTVTSLAASPYLRLRAQLASQTAYNGVADATFLSVTTGSVVHVGATAAYYGGLPATWTLDIPDLSAAGYDPAWGLRSGPGTSWRVEVVGGAFLTYLGAPPTAGAQVVLAGTGGSPTAFTRALQSKGIQRERPGGR